MTDLKTTFQELLPQFGADLDPLEALRTLSLRFAGRISFSSSFGIEDQVISHYIFSNQLPVRVFTLDTGRNFQETYSTWSRTVERYGHLIESYAPQADALEALLAKKGPNSFYNSVEDRKECCRIRKIEPLNRALKNTDLWVTGIRAEQSANRSDMQPIEWDAERQIIKFHPLFYWSFDAVQDFARKHKVPVNPLHNKGFVSIGCAPCTRAIQPGEDFRAGRWWWEDTSKKECGLHHG